MHKSLCIIVSYGSLFLIPNINARVLTRGEMVQFQAPTSTERCVILEKLPDGKYSKKDIELEKKLCAIDLHHPSDVALCAKTWSTSPGVIVYDVKSTNLNKEEFEKKICPNGKNKQAKKLAKFKTTMWESKTSSTYHKSSLAYYHLSRYFDTSLIVPVSIYREIDHTVHYNLSLQGNAYTNKGAIKYAWIANLNAHKNKESYSKKDVFFNEDLTTVQGILTKDSGEDVGPLVDGINSSWGKQSTIEFAETPAFMALKTDAHIDEAINKALKEYPDYIKKNLKKFSGGIFGKKNYEVLARLAEMNKGLSLISVLQMKSWMNEIVEMTILDTILGQEDRNLNISSKWYKYTLEDKNIESKSLDDKFPFHEIEKISKNTNEQVIQRIALNDNDAALLPGSTNFMRMTKLVEMIYHINPKTYTKLLQLQNDFNSELGVFIYFKDVLSLSNKELNNLTDNINYIANSLKMKCQNKKLKFDLQSVKNGLEEKTDKNAISTSCVL